MTHEARTSKYTADQLKFLANDRAEMFEQFLADVFLENADDNAFLESIVGLLVKIYALDLEGKRLTKMEACHRIPFRNQTISQKYVEAAQAKGFIDIVPDTKDKRRLRVVPLLPMIDYVNRYLENFADECREVVDRLSRIDDLPNDNVAMAGYSPREQQPRGSEGLHAALELKAMHNRRHLTPR